MTPGRNIRSAKTGRIIPIIALCSALVIAAPVLLLSSCGGFAYRKFLDYEGQVLESKNGPPRADLWIYLYGCTERTAKDECSFAFVARSRTDSAGHFSIHCHPLKSDRYALSFDSARSFFTTDNFGTSEAELKTRYATIIYPR